MREKIKLFIVNMMIYTSVVIVIFTIFNMFNFKSKLTLSDKVENLDRINNIKAKVNALEDNSCKFVFYDLINSYERTSFDGDVSLKEFYNIYMYEGSFMTHYSNIVNNCGISSEEMSELDMPKKFIITSLLFIDEVYMEYVHQYELTIKDYYFRLVADSESSNLRYQITKETEVDILETLFEYIYGGEINE